LLINQYILFLANLCFDAVGWVEGEKGIRPVKNWVVGCSCGYVSGSWCRFCIWPSWCHCHSLISCSTESRLVLPSLFHLSGAGSPG